MIKKHLIKTILMAAFLIGLFACKSTKHVAETANKQQSDKQKSTTGQNIVKEIKPDSSQLKSSADSLKYSENKCAGCENFIDSLKHGLKIIDTQKGVIKSSLDSVPAILKEVFPDVYFFKITTIMHSEDGIRAYFNGIEYTPFFDFNNLFKNDKNEIAVENKIKAFFTIYYSYNRNHPYTSLKITNKIRFLKENQFTYQVIVKSNEDIEQYLIAVDKNNQLKLIADITNELQIHYYSFSPISL